MRSAIFLSKNWCACSTREGERSTYGMTRVVEVLLDRYFGCCGSGPNCPRHVMIPLFRGGPRAGERRGPPPAHFLNFYDVHRGYLWILCLYSDPQGCLLRSRIGQEFAYLNLGGVRDQESLDRDRKEPPGEGRQGPSLADGRISNLI